MLSSLTGVLPLLVLLVLLVLGPQLSDGGSVATGFSRYECTYLTPGDHVPTKVHQYNGSMLVHSSLELQLQMRLRIINTSSANPPLPANESGLRGSYSVPAIFDKPCAVFNASCDIVSANSSYYNTNFSLQEPIQPSAPGGGGHVVRVLANWMPCLEGNGTFRLKGMLHMQSWGVLRDEFCIGQCCGSDD
jgi:hypothetical protein